MFNYKDCIKRKYKKPIYKKCKDLNLPVKEDMSIEELCSIYEKSISSAKKLSLPIPPKVPPKLQIIKKKEFHVEEKLKEGKFDELNEYVKKCFL